ncbi:16S rRNA (cytosine967-C5)-methyltransferase [Loktanella sp. PT4BL]|jgi:16S rRNA (cytosine967-C5)-methyltransferase|uniref:RsmB/NOP family class I SAM-dependent RNA methyltransferase n=1 Tax=Loktanella sp. PT4BL TaxID=2135611 RepID=UPI000D770787|nr:RsmB/NOP family class I SAM-dependent RNA methyltransferase [Loktanella sp. PT4BL]PXW70572.1 16S rRNA (cytosine967-C5)-methyltransferase [Loktanella sp. PT4BL]
MTPGARVAAAIAVLDQIQAGAVAEQALTTWARGSRFAGSKDRSAVRDHVFDVLRAKRSLGDGAGRELMQRLAQRESWPITELFSGDGHAPDPLTAEEMAGLDAPLTLSVPARCDLPDWLWPLWQESLGERAEAVALVQQGRADVFLRVNMRKGSVTAAMDALATDGVTVMAHPDVAGCLRVSGNPRRVKTAAAYLSGLVELQDAASQRAVRRIDVPDGARVLDYCAGGGGKALAFADLYEATVFAHDIAPQRMRDLPARAARAGVTITTLPSDALAKAGKFDVVFCDAPCTGSGTWRRTPDAKWRLGPEDLAHVMQSQDEVLNASAPLVAEAGLLVYATCSILSDENSHRVQAFCQRNPDWHIIEEHQDLPDANGDGFYTCALRRR